MLTKLVLNLARSCITLSNTLGHCVDAKSFADRSQGRATGVRLYLCGQSQQQGKAIPLCLGHAVSPKMFDEGMNMWGFCAEKYPSISFPHEIR